MGFPDLDRWGGTLFMIVGTLYNSASIVPWSITPVPALWITFYLVFALFTMGVFHVLSLFEDKPIIFRVDRVRLFLLLGFGFPFVTLFSFIYLSQELEDAYSMGRDEEILRYLVDTVVFVPLLSAYALSVAVAWAAGCGARCLVSAASAGYAVFLAVNGLAGYAAVRAWAPRPPRTRRGDDVEEPGAEERLRRLVEAAAK